MNSNDSKVWLITGSSTGFGRTLAETVLKQGDRLIATARKPEYRSIPSSSHRIASQRYR
ncbi:hypothetical protein [Mastigocoleus testarum]|uniref:hypothetical protein n=1 Tax=Mastigocoleus testarum TaxID=996925 RepID=UPI000A41A99F|nr:hypothetical protein [Mastigocoleus testarum]